MNNYIILKSTEEKILYPGKIEKLKFEWIKWLLLVVI